MTSLIPTIVALSGFFIQNFPHISWYPYWYLGNPYQFLIGPVVPVLLSFLNLFNLPLLYSYLFLIWGSFILGSFGIYLLLKDWGLEKKQALFSAFLYLVFPAGVFLLSYQNGLSHIALGFLPYILLLYRRFLQNNHLSSALLLSFLISFVLLIDISILLSLVVGFTSIFLSSNEEDKKDFVNLIGKTIVIILLSISIATLWYTPRFWLVNLVNPSFGGVPLFRLISSLFQFLLNLLPIGFAILVVRWRKFRPKGHMLFATLFFSSFLFLSIVRFLSDPDFVIDWISFLLQLQFGGTIIIGDIIWRARGKRTKLGIIGGLAFFSITGSIFILKNLSQPQGDYQKRIISIISKNVKSNERVFLSGSSVFWINSFLPVQQVRGGMDQASVHPFWAHGAYQIREGESQNLSLFWLRALGISYILVHEKDSQEPFHDFKQPEKFVGLKLVSAKEGDSLYQLEGGSIARVADLKILKASKPEGGADSQALLEYVRTIEKPLAYSLARPDEIKIVGKLKRDDIVSLAVTFDPRWRLLKGRGNITGDPLGNLVITPKDEDGQKFELQYQPFWYDWAIPMLWSGITLLILIFYRRLFPHIKNKLPDDEY